MLITADEIEIIMSTKQNILYNQGQPWVKKDQNPCDVTMGSWDGAEVSDLVGLYSLSQLKNLNLNIGLYRDDGLGVTTQRPQQVENTKKRICEIFRNMGLKITIEANKSIVDFLDITLDLSRNTFMPYLKLNNKLFYVNNQSKHPPLILKNIPPY